MGKGILAGYVRNSTLDQVNNLRADYQKKTLPELARKHGYDCVLCEEQGVSGESLDNRPVLQHILTQIRIRAYHGIAAVGFDRLSRDEDVLDGLQIWQTCARAGAVLVTPEQLWHPGKDHTDLLIAFIKFWQAAGAKQAIVQTLAEGMVQRARLAPVFRGRPPTGYARVPAIYTTESGRLIQGTTLAVDEPSRAAIERVFREFPTRSARSIAHDLNRDGVPHRCWSSWRGGMYDGIWYVNSVTNMVKKPIYYGRVSWGSPILDEPIWHEVPTLAFVDYDTWARCQIEKPGRLPKKGEKRTLEHHGFYGGVFSGVLRCPVCNALMASGMRKRGQRSVPVYQCVRYHHHGKQFPLGCTSSTQLDEQDVLAVVQSYLEQQLSSINLRALVATQDESAQQGRVKRSTLEERIRTFVQSRQKLLEDTLVGSVFTPDEINDKATDLANRIGAAQLELSKLEPDVQASEVLRSLAPIVDGGSMGVLFHRASRDDWRLLVRHVFESLVVEWDRPGKGRRRRVWVSGDTRLSQEILGALPTTYTT